MEEAQRLYRVQALAVRERMEEAEIRAQKAYQEAQEIVVRMGTKIRLGVELDGRGFFAEQDPVNAPLISTTEGIYLCGGATGPIDISESVTQAIAASLRAAAVNARCSDV